MKRSWVIGGVALVVVALVAALTARQWLFFLFEKSYPLLFESALLTRPSQEFGMDLRPNLTNARMVVAGRPHDPRYIVSQLKKGEVKKRRVFFVTTNADAFRGEPIPREKAPGELRIACIGDSITFGWGMDEALSWPGNLRTLLREAMPDTPTSVINAGIPGFPPDNIAPMIQHKLAPFRPDILIVMRNGNVLWEAPEQAYPQMLQGVLDATTAIGAKLVLALPPTSSFDLRPVNGTFAPMMRDFAAAHGLASIDFTPVFEEKGRGRGLKLEKDGRFQHLVRYQDGKREVVTSAEVEQPQVGASILAWLDESKESEALFIDEGHPDEEGTRLMGEQMLALMKEKGLLTPAPARN